MPNLKLNTGFDLGSSSSSDDDDAPLPFPTALPRSDFLAKDFNPAEYLSSLPQRHQTLEDLRAELRERSSAISTELLELVNNNYRAFLSLGSELRGGDEKVEDVKVALLGFRRAVEEIKGRTSARGRDVEALNSKLGEVRSDIELGREMLELDDRLSNLEHRLAVRSPTQPKQEDANSPFVDSSDEDEGDESTDDEGEGHFVCTSPARLTSLVEDLSLAGRLAGRIGRDTPFVAKAEERILKCRAVILIDLGNALKEAKASGPRGQGRLLKYLALYRRLNASGEAIVALRGAK